MKKINKEELHTLFRNIKNNDSLEFNKLYEKYRELVYGIAFSILKNKDEGEDIVQKVFLKIWKLSKDKLPTRNEASWLYSLTKNEVLSYLRNKKQELNIDDLYYISAENEELTNIIEEEKFNKIISRLNAKDQEIISLKILSGFSFKQISQMLQMPIGTVQWRYYKALNTLKTLITNLLMFIVTASIFIRRNVFKNIEKTGEIENTTSENAEINNQSENVSNSYDMSFRDKTSSTKLEDVEKYIKEESATNTIIENIGKQSNVRQDTKNIDNLLLGASSVFLCITIISLFFFMKHQQNARKKASK